MSQNMHLHNTRIMIPQRVRRRITKVLLALIAWYYFYALRSADIYRKKMLRIINYIRVQIVHLWYFLQVCICGIYV